MGRELEGLLQHLGRPRQHHHDDADADAARASSLGLSVDGRGGRADARSGVEMMMTMPPLSSFPQLVQKIPSGVLGGVGSH